LSFLPITASRISARRPGPAARFRRFDRATGKSCPAYNAQCRRHKAPGVADRSGRGFRRTRRVRWKVGVHFALKAPRFYPLPSFKDWVTRRSPQFAVFGLALRDSSDHLRPGVARNRRRTLADTGLPQQFANGVLDLFEIALSGHGPSESWSRNREALQVCAIRRQHRQLPASRFTALAAIRDAHRRQQAIAIA
jgi:hypothetical protein